VRREEGVDEARDRLVVVACRRDAAVDRRAPEPALERLAEGRPVAHAGRDARARPVGLAGPRRERVEDALLAAERQSLRVVEAEQDLDLAELRRLEAARRQQLVAEVEEVARRHRLDQPELLGRELEGADRPPQPARPRRERRLRHRVAREEVAPARARAGSA
jgi:hypothetical protein